MKPFQSESIRCPGRSNVRFVQHQVLSSYEIWNIFNLRFCVFVISGEISLWLNLSDLGANVFIKVRKRNWSSNHHIRSWCNCFYKSEEINLKISYSYKPLDQGTMYISLLEEMKMTSKNWASRKARGDIFMTVSQVPTLQSLQRSS